MFINPGTGMISMTLLSPDYVSKEDTMLFLVYCNMTVQILLLPSGVYWSTQSRTYHVIFPQLSQQSNTTMRYSSKKLYL
jgi:hypothetical protein